jgi:phosphatidylserine/phosphatidylglycerophosphate/cardiolipin synthase-like enzyme
MNPIHAFPPFRRLQAAALAAFLTMFVACATAPVGTTTGSTAPTTTNVPTVTPGGPTATPCVSACGVGTGLTGNATLITEPASGDTPVVQAINNAQKSIELEIYLLTESNVIHALENAQNRGVNVQVMLEMNPVGGATPSPQETLAELSAAGVKTEATAPNFALTHAKFMVIDGQTVFISSGNFTKSALGGSSYTADRDYMIVDTNATDVQQCVTIFQADWARTTPQITDPDLVVSPVNARAKILALIGDAKQSLHLEEEEMQDPAFIQALITAAHNGVKVEVVLPTGSSDDQGAQQLSAGGVHVVRLNDQSNNNPYIHAKIIIADGTLAYVGSVNASTQSMDQNREVGILLSDSQIIQSLDGTFGQDYTNGGGQ